MMFLSSEVVLVFLLHATMYLWSTSTPMFSLMYQSTTENAIISAGQTLEKSVSKGFSY